jgi:hypothetical protein
MSVSFDADVRAAPGAQEPVVPLERGSALKNQYPYVRFSLLASFDAPAVNPFASTKFPHEPSNQSVAVLRVPPDVQALNGTLASVRGFMLPLDTNERGVSRFVLAYSLEACKFGPEGQIHAIGRLNEWVLVTMTGSRRVPVTGARPITVFGRFEVQPQSQTSSVPASLYRMTADVMTVH